MFGYKARKSFVLKRTQRECNFGYLFFDKFHLMFDYIILLIQLRDASMKCACVSTRFFVVSILFVVLNMVAVSAMAKETKYKPFILAESNAAGDMASVVGSVNKKLTGNGFDVVGKYSPYPDTTILIVSSDRLRAHAAQSELGAHGAVQRVTMTKGKSGIQVSFTHPTYMAHAYRMKADLADVTAKLVKTLGRVKEYGPEEGLTKDELRSYQYKWLMPYFTDRHELASYKSQQAAIEQIETILASKAGGVAKVYRVDLPGKEESVFGVNLTGPSDNECSGDQYIMSRIDFKELKSSGHLPYEFVVSKGHVYALYAEFRIAINFPDLSMMGSNSFASIMCAPTAIKTALTGAAGGKEKGDDF